MLYFYNYQLTYFSSDPISPHKTNTGPHPRYAKTVILPFPFPFSSPSACLRPTAGSVVHILIWHYYAVCVLDSVPAMVLQLPRESSDSDFDSLDLRTFTKSSLFFFFSLRKTNFCLFYNYYFCFRMKLN